MAEAGRLYNEAPRAIKDKPEADCAEAHEQLGPPFVHAWVGVPAQLGGDEGVGARARVDRENLLGGQRGEECASAIGVAAVQEDRGQGRVDAHRALPRPGHSLTRAWKQR